MQFTLDINTGVYHLQGYSAAGFQVNGTTLATSLIITPDRLIEPWRPGDFDALTLADLQTVLELKAEVILLGTGANARLLGGTLYSETERWQAEHNVGIEVMTTEAACRTFNVLVSESRNVAAALLLT